MSTIDYQARRLVARLAVFDEGCAVFCPKDDANSSLSLVASEDGCFNAGFISEVLNLVEETEPAKFSNSSSYPSLFYEVSVDPMQGEGVRDYFGFTESETVVLEVPAALLWEQKQSAFLAAECELWMFTEKQCPLSQLMLDKWGSLTMLLKHVLSSGVRTQYLPKYWFAALAIRYEILSDQHSMWNELSDFRKSVALGDEVLSAAVTRNSNQPMHSLMVTDLPDLEIHTPSDGNVGCDAVLCQLNLVLEDASSSEIAANLPICFLVWKEDTMRLVASECLEADFKFLIGVNRYRKWHAANLMKSPTKVIENFKHFKAASAAAMARVALSGTPSQKLKAVGLSPVAMRMSPRVSPAVRSAQILSGLKKANRVQAVAILLKLQAQSWLQHVLTVLGNLMKIFTESLAQAREQRRQILMAEEFREKARDRAASEEC